MLEPLSEMVIAVTTLSLFQVYCSRWWESSTVTRDCALSVWVAMAMQPLLEMSPQRIASSVVAL